MSGDCQHDMKPEILSFYCLIKNVSVEFVVSNIATYSPTAIRSHHRHTHEKLKFLRGIFFVPPWAERVVYKGQLNGYL